VIVREAINKDEEMTINYLPLDWESAGATTAQERREVLKEDWGFHCMCQRCALEDDDALRIQAPSNMRLDHVDVCEHNMIRSDCKRCRRCSVDVCEKETFGEGSAPDKEEEANEGEGVDDLDDHLGHVDVCKHNRIRSDCKSCQ
jgi:hypothetical protein